jgi:hypothetical protein
MGWSPAEYAWDCHFFVERYFGIVFFAAEYLRGIFYFFETFIEREEQT